MCRPSRGCRRSSTLVLTAGLLTFFFGITLVVWGNQPYALPPFSGEAPVVLGPLRIPTQGVWLAAVAAAIIVGPVVAAADGPRSGARYAPALKIQPPHG